MDHNRNTITKLEQGARQFKESLKVGLLRLKWSLPFRKDPILVAQMGKVGSSTIVKALSELGVGPVLQLHLLSEAWIKNGVRKIRLSPVPRLDSHIIKSLALANRLRSANHLKIITLTRDPVERALSFLFQDHQRMLLTSPDQNNFRDEFLKAAKVMLQEENPHFDPGKWFDSQLADGFGIDFLRCSPKLVGRNCYLEKNGGIEALCLRMEDLAKEESWKVISNFIGVEVKKGTASNVGGKKDGGKFYRKLVEEFKLPEEKLLRIYSTKYSKTFYDEDRERLVQKWAAKC